MLLLLTVLLIAGAVALTFWVRPQDLPVVEPPPPWQHLEERKARIYENLRDLQFEYRVGKLSDEDYQSTKKSLQLELAGTLAEMDALKAAKPAAGVAASKKTAPAAKATKFTCPHCKAEFDKAMKFCGECGKAMEA
jgi:DNA-directed RNA polymerase subunit M/transcription elongation factor TFIIS